MKQAIHDGHDVVRHEEFLGNLMAKCDGELLDLYLESDPTVPDRMEIHGGISYPQSRALVRKLLARGLDANKPNWLGKTFLHACAENGDRSVATVLLDAGADINAQDLEFKATPLAAAVRSSCGVTEPTQVERGRRMIEFLLARGAATNLPGDEPWATPLTWARKGGLAAIEKMLVKHGAT